MGIKKIKTIITDTYWGEYTVSILHCFESKLLPMIISDEKAVKCYYKKHTGKDLNLSNPQTFSEKMNWYKLNHRDPLMKQCADKVGVRDYVKACGYGDALNEVYGVYDSADQIDSDALPDQFVLKAAHGSQMQYIVKEKKTFDWKRAKRMMKSWLRQNIYWSGREWVYKDMPRRIIAEEYMEDETGELKDYKFFCFSGKAKFMELDGGRYTSDQYRNYYDMDMGLLPYADVDTPCKKDIAFPVPSTVFKEMEEMACMLSKPFQFVRVDFYVVGQKIYVGEMTFFDSGGSVDYTIPEYDKIIGEYWKLSY